MSVEHPTEKQMAKVVHLHRAELGYVSHFGVPDHSKLIKFCSECRVPHPCRTMRALGAKA